MKISELIEKLQREMTEHGDISVTCTATYYKDGYSERGVLDDVWESTVGSMLVSQDEQFDGDKRLRLMWQC